MQGSQYTDEQRRQAVVAYHVLGSGAAVKQQLGIPESTLCEWRKEEWWHHLSEEMRRDVRDELESGLTTHLRKSLAELGDRLENGDEVPLKTGQVVRLKMRGRDLAVTASILFDKRQLLLNRATSISESRSIDMTADQMVGAFRRAVERTERVVEGEVIETEARPEPNTAPNQPKSLTNSTQSTD